MKVKIIWYDLEGEKATDIIDNVKDTEEALRRGFLKYNGNPPAEMHSLIVMG